MKIIRLAAASAAMAFAAIPFASPAAAQGTTGVIGIASNGSCPDGYTRGSATGNKAKKYPNSELCYPESDNPPAVFKKAATGDACPSGMRSESSTSVWCTTQTASAVYTPPTYGSIKKANQMDRCPVGYWTDQADIKSCVSPYQDKAPASRLKKGAACSADEIDEWGIYCTSRLHKLSRSEAENTAVADVNNLFVLSNGGTSPQGAEYENTPGIVALFPTSGMPQASSAAATSTSADQATSQTAQCTTDSGSATGAAIGGAVGGDAGAVLGSVLGGLGKKKKKKGC